MTKRGPKKNQKRTQKGPKRPKKDQKKTRKEPKSN